MLTNERTLLSVVVELKTANRLWERFLLALEEMLNSFELSLSVIGRELEQMKEVQFARNTNRSVLGSMNDFVFLIRDQMQIDPGASLHKINWMLSTVPCGPLEMRSPEEETRRICLELNRNVNVGE